MKLKNIFKSSHIQHFLVAIIIYATGFLLDKFAQNNFFFNLIGMLLELISILFAGFNLTLLFDSGLVSSRKSGAINLIILTCCIIPIIFFTKFITIPVLMTIGIFMLFTLVMLVISLYKMTKLYVDIINDEKKRKEITKDSGEIFDWFEMSI